MTSPHKHRGRWPVGPLAVYIAGILMPALVASLRPGLLPLVGLPAFAVLFWLGPFASAAAVFWSRWSASWKVAWIVLVPVLAAPTFIPLLD